jgi:hypothetical protein
MSGAEVFALAGAVASFSQLVDYADKSGSYLLDVLRKVRSSPEALRTLYEEVCNVRSETKKLEFLNVSDEFRWFVRACVTECDALIGIIDNWHLDKKNVGITPARDRIALGFKWKWRERPIREHLEKLSRYKASLAACSATSVLICQAIPLSEPVSCLPLIGHDYMAETLRLSIQRNCVLPSILLF